MTTKEKKSQAMVSDEIHRLQEEVEALRKSEEYYRCLFENAPVALMEENFSEIKVSIDNLREQGVRDFRAYFKEHPETAMQYYDLIPTEVEINKEYVVLYKAKSKEQLISKMEDTILTEHSLHALEEFYIALADGKKCFSTETIDNALDGSPVHSVVTWTIAAGYEDTWARILVSVIPFQRMSPK